MSRRGERRHGSGGFLIMVELIEIDRCDEIFVCLESEDSGAGAWVESAARMSGNKLIDRLASADFRGGAGAKWW
jgi:hypothetical protein